MALGSLFLTASEELEDPPRNTLDSSRPILSHLFFFSFFSSLFSFSLLLSFSSSPLLFFDVVLFLFVFLLIFFFSEPFVLVLSVFFCFYFSCSLFKRVAINDVLQHWTMVKRVLM